ncbi:MAG TPA: selenocysteine-specific translation elongation factor [Gaiellaceae bacterium]|nr:selenocysteine-specific translation elongation factor [Gaiellaceae bacterium]
MPLTVGTAGHIDHGKTWLVRALTGKDTDRLPEERRRGISIALGYAPLELPDGLRLSLVDVPGHERFVRTMVAGATGIDLFLLVVDAAEGARPQTHEHLAILRLLDVDRGVVAVTKADAVDEETLALAVEEAAELVPGAEVVPVSAKTGAGLAELRGALARVAEEQVAQSHKVGPPRLYVDRAFAYPGIGTVVTGTLLSGSIGAGDALRLEPGGPDVRVRSVQVHDEPMERAEAGQRVAVSLPGVDRRSVRRGVALVPARTFPTSYRLDVALDELAPIADGARLLVHHGTSATPARVARAGARYAQLRLDRPVVAARGDRVVLRSGTTLGGGVVLDPAPPRHRSEERFAHVERGNAAALVHEPVELVALSHLLDGTPAGLEQAGRWVFSRAWLDELERTLRERIAAGDPLDPGVPVPPDPWAADVVPLLGLERRGAKLYLPGAAPDLGERAEEAARLEEELAGAGFEPVKVGDARLAAFLEERGTLVRVGEGLAVSRGAYDEARRRLVEECERAGRITLARFRDLLGASRRPAQLLLERFDADGLTRRVGDERVLRRSARGARAPAPEGAPPPPPAAR